MSYSTVPERPLAIAAPFFPEEEQQWLRAELTEILNGKLSAGPRTSRFERGFSDFCGTETGIAFPSCTAALETAMVALAVRPGDEVLVPVETFVATAMAVHMIGAKPVFTEIDANTFCMDFEAAWSQVTERTRGAIVVHFGGRIAPDFPAFVERMHASGRFVVEDCAHAHGAELDGRMAGSFADAGCFSFYPTKIMTTGEGGMLVTSRADVAQIARSLQHRGRDLESAGELYKLPGRNNRFTEVAAAMGISQLRCLPEFLAARREVARAYDEAFQDFDSLRPLPNPANSASSYWRYTMLSEAPIDRIALRDTLATEHIAIDWAYDPPLHLQPVFQELYHTHAGMLPYAESLMSRHICLPVNARMLPEDAEFVAEQVRVAVTRQTSQ